MKCCVVFWLDLLCCIDDQEEFVSTVSGNYFWVRIVWCFESYSDRTFLSFSSHVYNQSEYISRKPLTLLGSETAVLAKSAFYTELFGDHLVCVRSCCRILRQVRYSVRHLSSAVPSQSVFSR